MGGQELEPREDLGPREQQLALPWPRRLTGQSAGRQQPVSRALALTLSPGSQVRAPRTPTGKGPFLPG